MGGLLRAGESAEHLFLLLALAMARTAPVLSIAPFLAGRRLSHLVRTSLALSLAAFLIPWLRETSPDPGLGFREALPILVKETLLGTAVGLVSSFVFYAALGVGFLVDNQRGLSMSQMDDPMSGEATSPLGIVVFETMAMAFIAVGGLALFVQALLTSYAFWPPFSFWPDWTAAAWRELLLGQFSLYMTTIMALSFPMLLVCFLVDLGMGLMNRFAPQLNVFFLAMPVKSGLALALMLAYWTALFMALGREALGAQFMWDRIARALSIV